MARSGADSVNAIYVTSAANDRDLAPLFPPNSPVTETAIPFGDVAFYGLWQNSAKALFTFERKKIIGLAGDIETGRHLDQIRRANEVTHQTVVQYLIVEGHYREGRFGTLETLHDGSWRDAHFSYRWFQSYLDEIELYTGVHVVYTTSPSHTVSTIMRYYTLTRQAPDSHSVLKTFYKRPTPAFDWSVTRPSFVRRVYRELDHVDWVRSGLLEARFHDLPSLYEAGTRDLKEVNGIGDTIAKSIWKQLHERRK
jgi:ERCC4-type nuclease